MALEQLLSFLHGRPLESFNKSTGFTLAFFFSLFESVHRFVFITAKAEASKLNKLNNLLQIAVPHTRQSP